jgi:tRNA threonylcarbamoyl adenosine modification protein (Sua5/YciO/YrdC/YwlC family)
VNDPIADAAAAALGGQLVVLPTDTVYGIGTRPDTPMATARLFEVKGRPRELELPVLVPDVAAARGIARFDERAEILATRFWPGPLTIVLTRTEVSAGWDLGGDPSTVGVRVPRHPMALAVLSLTGPLAVTSANRSGLPTPTTCDELDAAFGDRVAVYLCQEAPLVGTPSTVIALLGGGLRILREGSLPLRTLAETLGGGVG